MYRIFVFLFVLSIAPIYAAGGFTAQSPYFTQYYSPQAFYGGDYIPNRRFSRQNRSVFSDINDLERYALNRNFTRDSDRTRLERLETMTFGAVQDGDIYTRYDNVRNAILSRPKQNYKTSILRSIGDYFSGQLTGYTPQLKPQAYGLNSVTESSTPFGRSYTTNEYGIDSNSSLKILD